MACNLRHVETPSSTALKQKRLTSLRPLKTYILQLQLVASPFEVRHDSKQTNAKLQLKACTAVGAQTWMSALRRCNLALRPTFQSSPEHLPQARLIPHQPPVPLARRLRSYCARSPRRI